MAGQGIERREVLRYLAMGAVAARFPGFHRWAFVCNHESPATQIRPATYSPKFFSPAEYATIERLAEMIIPSDTSPGAREAGASEFIDFIVGADPGIQYRFRYGLTWLDAHSQKLTSKAFRELSPEQQTAILEPLAYKAKFRAGEEDGREFFKLMREYTVMGFYTTEIGLKELDFPGLRRYSEATACPHGDDREHLHLPTPKY